MFTTKHFNVNVNVNVNEYLRSTSGVSCILGVHLSQENGFWASFDAL